MCQPSSTSSCMRCGLLGAWHSTGGSCTVPAAWPEVRLAQRLLSSVCAAQHQPWLWGSPSRSRAGCLRPAAAQQCHLLGPGNLRDGEQKPREQRTWAGGAVWVLGAPCGSCQPAGFGPHPAQDALQRRGIASSATSSTVGRGSFPGLVLKLSFRKQGCPLGLGGCSCRVLSARCLHEQGLGATWERAPSVSWLRSAVLRHWW